MPAKPCEPTLLKPFDAADYLDSPEAVAEYLVAAAELNDPSVFIAAVGVAARAAGMSRIAGESGIRDEGQQNGFDSERP